MGSKPAQRRSPPNGWSEQRLGSLCSLVVPMRDKPKRLDGNVPWIRIEDFDGKYVSSSKSGQGVDAETIQAMKLKVMPVGTVLCSCSCNMGVTAVVRRELVTNQTFIGVVPNDGAESEYLYYLLGFSKKELNRLSSGTTIGYLPRSAFDNLSLLFPPLPEQRKIAAILSSVDDAIEKTRAVIDQVQIVKRGLMQELLTRGLPGRHTRFKQTEIGDIPEGWEVVALSSVASVERGKFAHRPRNDPRFYGGQHPFIQTGDVAACDGLIDTYSQTLNEEGLAISRLFPSSTIVVTIAANIGATGIAAFDVAFPDSLVGIQTGPRIDTRFLELVLQTRKRALDRFAPESAQKNINLNTLKPLKIPLPDLVEQTRIAGCVWSIIMRLKSAYGHLESLTLLKTTLMSALLTGELRVTPDPRVTPRPPSRMTPKLTGRYELRLAMNPTVVFAGSAGMPPDPGHGVGATSAAPQTAGVARMMRCADKVRRLFAVGFRGRHQDHRRAPRRAGRSRRRPIFVLRPRHQDDRTESGTRRDHRERRPAA